MKKNHTLKVHEQPGMITIQTNDMAFQAIFSTTVLQFMKYHEEVQKFKCRAALASININQKQFQRYFQQTRQRVQHRYNSLLFRSGTIIYDIILSLKFSKAQVWNQMAQVANKFRYNVYRKNVDPYNFNVSDFDNDQKMALQTLLFSKQKADAGRNIIQALTQRLKNIQSARLNDFYAGKVTNPYIAQAKGIQVYPSALFSSFMTQMKTQWISLGESIVRYHSAIHQSVHHFVNQAFQHSVKLQQIACEIIKKYFEKPVSLLTKFSITQQIDFFGRRHKCDAQQLFSNKGSALVNRNILVNGDYHVEFKPTLKVYDLNTKEQEIVQFLTSDYSPARVQRKQQNKKQARQQRSYIQPAERRRMQRDFHHQSLSFHPDMQRRFMDERRRQNLPPVRKINRCIIPSAPWQKMSEDIIPLLYYYNTFIQRTQKVWTKIKKPMDKQKQYDQLGYKHPKPQNQTASKPLSKQQQYQLREEAINYQAKRTKEENARIARLSQVIARKSYQKFLKLSKIQSQKRAFCDQKQISRFGINLMKDIGLNNLKQVNKFIYLYFKERYFRQNANANDNDSIPIMSVSAEISSFSAEHNKVGSYVRKILQKVEETSFFVLWTQDIIVYKKIETSQGCRAYFEIYVYSAILNTQKFIYEMKRRLDMPVQQKIITMFYTLTGSQQVLSRLENMYRIMYNRHLQTNNCQMSVYKGKQIWSQILEQLQYK